jgi:hypothetical protein
VETGAQRIHASELTILSTATTNVALQSIFKILSWSAAIAAVLLVISIAAQKYPTRRSAARKASVSQSLL